MILKITTYHKVAAFLCSMKRLSGLTTQTIFRPTAGPCDSVYICCAAMQRPPDPRVLGFVEARDRHIYDRHISDLAFGLREVILEEALDASKSIYHSPRTGSLIPKAFCTPETPLPTCTPPGSRIAEKSAFWGILGHGSIQK